MTDNILGKILLSPFSLLYGIGVGIRNVLYDSELIKSSKFGIPIISVGNLSVGGAGKTPHVEYLIQQLSPYINVAILSRGYKRKTKGFRLVNSTDTARLSGDEPLMYKRKYSDIVVAVGENRALAIPEMVGRYPATQTIILDDAFQHRSVLPGKNILLTTYDQPFVDDHLLPSGRLREWRSSYKRADIIIVTKCPEELSDKDRQSILQRIKPLEHQDVYFTKYTYWHPYSIYDSSKRIALDKSQDVVLLSAIADTRYLLSYLKKQVNAIHHLNYEDHHDYSEDDINHLIKVYNHREADRKMVVTTEKDAMRLEPYISKLREANIPIYILPLRVQFLFEKETEFIDSIKSYLLNVKV